MRIKFEHVVVVSFLLTIAVTLANSRHIGPDSKRQPNAPAPITASAVLLPDYTWHIADSRKISFSFDGKEFCFNENIGERVVETCGPKESLLGWRLP
jgi:hypothetical protein